MLLVHQQQQRRRRWRPGWQLWPQDTQKCTSVAPVPAARTVKDTHLIRPLNSRVAAAAQSVCSWQRGRRSGGGAGPQVKCKFVGAAFTTSMSGVCVVHFRPWAMLGGVWGAHSVTRACWGTCAMCLLRLGRAGVCVWCTFCVWDCVWCILCDSGVLGHRCSAISVTWACCSPCVVQVLCLGCAGACVLCTFCD